MAEDTQQVAIGETIGGKYRVEQLLGAGGMGFVVAATNLTLGTKVALKFLRGGATAEWRARLEREAQVAATLTSPHVARVHDFGEHEGLPYLVMEFLPGQDLGARLAEGPLPVGVAAGLLVQACEAIAEAHALGIVHRDLKPQNLFLVPTPSGGTRLKVLDFGIAKRAESFAFRAEERSLTQTGTMLGSPLYMSPEQLTAPKDVDRRTDLWSLGVILHEMLVGEPPFDGTTLIDLSMKICAQAPPRVDALRPEVPAALADVVARCLEKHPDDRFPLVEDLAAAVLPFATAEALGGPGSSGRGARSLPPSAVVPPVAAKTLAASPSPAAAPPTGGDTARAWEEQAPSTPPPRPGKVAPIVAGFLLLAGALGIAAALRARAPGPELAAPSASVAERPTVAASPVPPASVAPVASAAAPTLSAPAATPPTGPRRAPAPSATAAASAPPSAATSRPPTPKGANGSPVITD